IAGAVKYSTRFECYARVGMVTASTAGVDCCISFGGWQRPQVTGTVGTRVLHRAQGGRCQRRLSLLERAGRYDRFKIRLTEFAMAARPRNGRVAVAGSRDLKKMDALMVRSGQETKSGVAGQK